MKRLNLKNRILLFKYPWLRPWGETGFEYTMAFDNMRGWWKAFGKMFCEDVQKIYYKNPELYILEIKEKYGRLDIYFGNCRTDDPMLIAHRYEIISQNVCFKCGKPDVSLTNAGWILPLCKDCYEGKRPYEEVVISEARMNSVVVSGKNEPSEFPKREELARRIRKEWKNKSREKRNKE